MFFYKTYDFKKIEKDFLEQIDLVLMGEADSFLEDEQVVFLSLYDGKEFF